VHSLGRKVGAVAAYAPILENAKEKQDLRNNRLIGSIDLTELLQKLWIAAIEADDLCKLGAVAPFMFYYFTPNFHLTK